MSVHNAYRSRLFRREGREITIAAGARTRWFARSAEEPLEFAMKLDRERESVRLELERLRDELIALDSAATTPVALPTSGDKAPSMTSSEKVALFRSLFRGRDDVYPKLWENNRTSTER